MCTACAGKARDSNPFRKTYRLRLAMDKRRRPGTPCGESRRRFWKFRKEYRNDTGDYQQDRCHRPVGGGIRSYQDAAGWLDAGVKRVILGTLAVEDPAMLTLLSDAFGRDRIMAGVDAREGKIAVEGWQRTAGDYIGWAQTFEERGAGSLLFTNVDVEGLQQGICSGPVSRLIDSVQIPVVVAGGISSGEDVRVLKEIGAYGVVLGSALYSGKLTLGEALEAADEKG